MEESLINLLSEWKIPETYIIKLEDQEVYSISTLLLLSDTQVKAIFDKVGTQATFFHNLNQLRNKDKTTDQTSETSQNDNGTTEAGAQRNEGDDSIRNEGDLTNDQETVDVPVNGPETTAYQQNQCEKRSQPAQAKATRKRSAASLGNILEMELDTLLTKSLQGKEVLSYYKLQKDLDESHRNKLADVILGHYLKDDHDKRLPTDVEDEIANLIIELFETECKQTWISDTENHRESSIGRGVLVKRYYHIRRGLKKSGMLATSSKNNESTNRFNFLGNAEESEEVKEMLSWLNFNKQPWSKLIDYWKQTSEARLRVHINGTQSISDYMDTYISLKDKSGYLLLEADFESHFGNSNNLYTQWPMFAAFIEKRAPREVLEGIKDSLTAEGKKVQTIRALAHVLPVVTVARNKHKSFRPSRQEIEDAILLIVKCVGDIKNELTNRLQKYEPFHLTLSPQAVLVGNDADSIQKSFVRINEVLYEVETPLKALDITFKSMHVLDTKYHEECKREWLFLERAVYKINVNKKGLNSATANLVRDFERFKENSA